MTEQEFLDDMRTYEKDHEPDGWPAVQMKKVTHLLDIIDRQNAEIRRLQDLIKIPDPQQMEDLTSEIMKLLLTSETEDAFPPYRCLPPINPIMAEIKAQSIYYRFIQPLQEKIRKLTECLECSNNAFSSDYDCMNCGKCEKTLKEVL